MAIFKFLYHWGGSVLMAAAFLIGIPDSFSVMREFASWASPWGIQPIHFAFWLLGLGAIYTAIVQGIRIRHFEKARPEIEVSPNESIGENLVLVVHNISRVSASVAAVMSCELEWDGNALSHIQRLKNASMCWETSGINTDTINADGKRILKLCNMKKIVEKDKNVRCITFYKMENGMCTGIDYAYSAVDTRILSVMVSIHFDSTPPLKYKQNWSYVVSYSLSGDYLTISRIRTLSTRRLANKLIRYSKNVIMLLGPAYPPVNQPILYT